ncbi:MAG: hypothetical protein II008_20290 [Oscillospiraceae bacterium]|nr:hypothetical protein [Oscillospiraceae bacterium]
MMEAIKPIETIYHGYRFRSRLEARWAVFLDSLGVKYEYEPEGFKLPDGSLYLPDFRVMCHASRGQDCEPFPLYIEVKGVMDEASAKKIKAFSWYSAFEGINLDLPDDEILRSAKSKNRQSLLIVSDIPNIEYADDIHDSRAMGSYDCLGFDLYPHNYETVDGDHFGAYPCAWNGHFGLFGDDSSYTGWGDPIHTAYAYIAARRARFEYGERPQLVPMDCRGRLRLQKAQDIFGAIT